MPNAAKIQKLLRSAFSTPEVRMRTAVRQLSSPGVYQHFICMSPQKNCAPVKLQTYHFDCKNKSLQNNFSLARGHSSVPAFIQRLVGQCVAEGDSVRLEARVVGTPYPTICWKRGPDQVLPEKRIQ